MPNIYQSHKAIYNNVKTIEEPELKAFLFSSWTEWRKL